jgi:L-lactate dehydrogenase complex protein LldE
MKVGLVIPCYIDMLYPEVGIATLELLATRYCRSVAPC